MTEKTLADFSDDELYSEITKRDYFIAKSFIYKQGYEAGKRDAEPKWISVANSLPDDLTACPVILNDNATRQFAYRSNGRWQLVNRPSQGSLMVTHYMLLPKIDLLQACTSLNATKEILQESP